MVSIFELRQRAEHDSTYALSQVISLANDKEYIWIIVEVDMYDHGNMGVHVECLAARAHGAPDIVLAQFLTDLTDVYLHVREEAKSTYRVRWNEIARKYPHLNI